MKYAPLLLALALAGCGTLPQPFYGYPGRNAAKLAVPPVPVLFVPVPDHALMSQQAAKTYAQDLTTGLVSYGVPTVAGPVEAHNWQIQITASYIGDYISPLYTVIGPNKKTYGTLTGAVVAASAWQTGDTAVLSEIAERDSAKLSDLMAHINAQVQQSSPESLANRTPRLFIGTVHGAPGDGDTALTDDLAEAFPKAEIELVPSPKDADFSVTGEVKTSPAEQGQVLVQLNWIVRDSNDRLVGQVTQLHDLKPTEITPYWGDVAVAATQEAANGILTVVHNDIVKKSSTKN